MTNAPSDIGGKPYDGIIKVLFNLPGVGAAFLAEHLDPKVAKHFKLETTMPVQSRFTDTTLQQFESDSVLSVETTTIPPPLGYVDVEHQSSSFKGMLTKVLGYQTRIIEWHVEREGDDGVPMPPVMAFVIYHNPSPWNAPRSASETWGNLGEDASGFLNPGYRLVDIGRIEDDRLSRHPEIFAVFLALKYVQRPEFHHAKLPKIMDALVRAPLMRMRVFALLTKYQVDRALLMQEVRRAMPKEEETMLTVEQQIKNTVEQQIKNEVMAQVVQRQLNRRFGSLSPAVQDRISRADNVRLEQWGDRLLFASSLEEVFAEQQS